MESRQQHSAPLAAARPPPRTPSGKQPGQAGGTTLAWFERGLRDKPCPAWRAQHCPISAGSRSLQPALPTPGRPAASGRLTHSAPLIQPGSPHFPRAACQRKSWVFPQYFHAPRGESCARLLQLSPSGAQHRSHRPLGALGSALGPCSSERGTLDELVRFRLLNWPLNMHEGWRKRDLGLAAAGGCDSSLSRGRPRLRVLGPTSGPAAQTERGGRCLGSGLLLPRGTAPPHRPEGDICPRVLLHETAGRAVPNWEPHHHVLQTSLLLSKANFSNTERG